MPFLLHSASAITDSDNYNWLFLLSLPILLISLIILITSTISIGRLLKPVLVLNIMISSLLLYATSAFGVVFDSTMIQNGLETDSAEAFSYINIYFILFILITGVLPSLCVAYAKIKKQTFVKATIARTLLVTANVIVVFIIASVFFSSYASVGRNNSELLAYITPYKFIDASAKLINKQYLSPPLDFQMLDNSPYIVNEDNETHVTVLVVGETARAQSFSLNGYTQNTNQYTKSSDVISFTNVSSCGTATAVSLPCMFSRLHKHDFDNRLAKSQQNLLDLASIAGIDVLWVDNNNGSCKGVCARVNTLQIAVDKANPLCDGEYCLDEALLAPLKTKLSDLHSNHTLIVLHMIGSHGPTYFKRYPQDKRPFLPDCQRSDIQNCSEQELVNTYDNTIAYTDFVLSEIIQILTEAEVNMGIKASMLYISDHGESLGEKGVFLHGLPYAFAPQEQTHIPMLYWQTSNKLETDTNCLKAQKSSLVTHDNYFDIVLGVMSISTSVYDPNSDLFFPCRTNEMQLALKTSLNRDEIDLP